MVIGGTGLFEVDKTKGPAAASRFVVITESSCLALQKQQLGFG